MSQDSLTLQEPPSGVPERAWAKAPRNSEDWMPLYRHLDDTTCVAWCLWDEWLSPNARSLITQQCGSDAKLAKRLAALLAAGHDIGKHSSAFAEQVTERKNHMIDGGATFLSLTDDERKQAPHAIVSALSFIDWYESNIRNGYSQCVNAIAGILASHHGTFAQPAQINRNQIYEREKQTKPMWHHQRMAWWDRAITTVGLTNEDLEKLQTIELSESAQLILSGFLIMCDWVASNEQLFPLVDLASSFQRTDDALNSLQLPPQWEAHPPADDTALFTTRFQLPNEAKPRPVQTAAMRLARKINQPCLMLIEAPTGEGKTEAALGAAEILAQKFGLNGVTFALPTCATSDGIFPRIITWLGTTLQPGLTASAVLTHGRANLNENYLELFSPKRVGNIYDSETASAVHAHWWLRGRKTSALANFTVGTIDQVLFAALSSRHIMLRHTGLSGKVVIFDEIHASDTYMMVFLERVLQWLGAMGVPAIALSATLDPARRSALLTAYKKGAARLANTTYKFQDQNDDEINAKQQCSYPIISVASEGPLTFQTLRPSGRTATYSVEFIGPDISDIIDFITEIYTDGGCIGVLCNTVERAQTVYSELVGKIPSEEVILLHLCFLATERRNLERDLAIKLGPNSANRPRRFIVVATQVIEQSLDIDFDLLYTDIAPIDLLIQRAGRLQRHTQHNKTRADRFSRARLAIGGFSLEKNRPPELESGSATIYGEALLLRSLATLLEETNDDAITINSPTDVARLVRKAYSCKLRAPNGWETRWRKAEVKQIEDDENLQNRAQLLCITEPNNKTLLGFDKTIAKAQEGGIGSDHNHRGRAQVRDAEDSIEVIVVQEIKGELRALPFMNKISGVRLDFTAGVDDELARQVSMCTVSLPSYLLDGALGDRVIAELEDKGVDSWQRSPWLRGQLPLVLNENLEAKVAGYLIRYDRKIGLQIHKDE